MNDRIVKNLFAIRKNKNDSQEETAAKLGMSRMTYAAIESGKKNITVDIIEKFSKVYDTPTSRLIFNICDAEKFKQMLFYILSLFPLGVPKTKLAKLLYLSDFGFYHDYGSSISGANYIHRQYGPVAENFLELIDSFWLSGKISINILSEGAFMISSLMFNNKYDLLNEKEKHFIEEVCRAWEQHSTVEVVNFTHQQKPWASTVDGEFIPYESISQEINYAFPLNYTQHNLKD